MRASSRRVIEHPPPLAQRLLPGSRRPKARLIVCTYRTYPLASENRPRSFGGRVIVGFAAIVVLSALAVGMPATATDQIPASAKRSPLSLRPSHAKRDLPRARTGREETAIRDENNRAGSTGWQIANGDLKPRPIEGFADRVSGQLGDRVRLFVTTRAPSFEVLAYRTGWYGGIGARLIWRSGPVPGRAQPRCAVLTETRTVDCSNWAPSLSIKIGPQWIQGQYLFKLVQSDGSSSFVPFIVRNDHSHAAIVVIAAVTTIEAYNSWGGYSLYGDQSGHRRFRSTVVSFDRPLADGPTPGSCSATHSRSHRCSRRKAKT